jgi:hypothetical protein
LMANICIQKGPNCQRYLLAATAAICSWVLWKQSYHCYIGYAAGKLHLCNG